MYAKIILIICLVPSGAPLNFSATEITSMSFDLVWELPAPSERNGIITGYNISITSLNSPLGDPQHFFTTSLSITVDSLDPHTDYICIIAANTAIGIGAFSFEMNVRTDQDGMHFNENACSIFIASLHCSTKCFSK